VHLVGINLVSLFIMNMVGFASLIAVAYVVSWFKSAPWKGRASQPGGSGAVHGQEARRKVEEKRAEETDDYARQFGNAPAASPAE
jgi:hypothetical protein